MSALLWLAVHALFIDSRGLGNGRFDPDASRSQQMRKALCWMAGPPSRTGLEENTWSEKLAHRSGIRKPRILPLKPTYQNAHNGLHIGKAVPQEFPTSL